MRGCVVPAREGVAAVAPVAENELGEVVEPSVPAGRGTGTIVARNTIINLAAQGLPLIVGLVAVPRVIAGLGVPRYGVLTLAWTLLGYLSIFDFGLTRATTKYVAELAAAGRHRDVPSVAGTAIAMQVGLGVLGGILLAIAAHPLASRILHVPPELVGEAFACFMILAVAVPIVLLSNSLRGLLEAAQRFDLVNLVRVPANTLYYLLPLIGVLLHWSLGTIMLGFVASWIVAIFAQYHFCTLVYPEFGARARFSAVEAPRLLRFGGWATVSGTISPVLVYADRVIIGSVLSVAAVSYYAAPFDMVTRLLVVPSSLVGTLFPAFSAISSGSASDEMSVLLTRSTKYLLLVLAPVVILITFFAQPLLHAWLGADFGARSTRPLQFLAFGVLMNALAQIPFSLVQARGRPDIAARFHIGELPLHLLLIWTGVHYWGIAGAALAWSFRALCDAVLLYWAALRLAGTRWVSFRHDHLPEIVATFVMVSIALLVATRIKMSIAWQCGLVLVLGIAFLRIIWVHAIDDTERGVVRRLARVGRK